MSRFPARIHVLLAREAPVGLVIRRGPSKAVATIKWDRSTDTFELGQWMRGRIYERRSDLSPNGKHLIYFAMNGRWDDEAQGAWTAISRAPFLKALTLLAKGDCWNGGGLWTGAHRYWVNDGYGHEVVTDTRVLVRDMDWRPLRSWGNECTGVYYLRLLRDGWTHMERRKSAKGSVDVFEKPCSSGWILRKLAHAEIGAPPGKGCYWDGHQLVRPESSSTIECPTWEWAEMDGKRLVWATEGRIETANVTHTGLSDTKVIHDFNDMRFEEIRAPY